MKRWNYVLVLSIAMALFSLSVAPAVAGVHEDLAELVGHMRKQGVVDDSALRNTPPLELLTELRNYLVDPDIDVRMVVLGLSVGILQRNAENPENRQQIAGFLFDAAKSDPRGSVGGYAASVPYSFSLHLLRTDFTDVMRQEIMTLISQERPPPL
jgi:hypothetical protein